MRTGSQSGKISSRLVVTSFTLNIVEGYLGASSATTLNYARDNGNKILINGSVRTIPAAGYSRVFNESLIDATGADTGAGTVADTFYHAYVSNGLATFSPDSLRLSSTAPTLVDGVNYLGAAGNALNWIHIGWVFTNATNRFDTQEYAGPPYAAGSFDANFHIMNRYNRRLINVLSYPSYTDDSANNFFTTAASAVIVGINNGNGDNFSIISNGEDETEMGYSVLCQATTTRTTPCLVGLGWGTSAANSRTFMEAPQVIRFGETDLQSASDTRKVLLPLGRNLVSLNVMGNNDAVLMSWYGNSARFGNSYNGTAMDILCTSLIGRVRG